MVLVALLALYYDSATLLRRLRLWFSPGCDGSGWRGPSGTVLGRLCALLLPRLPQRGAGFVEALAGGLSAGFLAILPWLSG